MSSIFAGSNAQPTELAHLCCSVEMLLVTLVMWNATYTPFQDAMRLLLTDTDNSLLDRHNIGTWLVFGAHVWVCDSFLACGLDIKRAKAASLVMWAMTVCIATRAVAIRYKLVSVKHYIPELND